jgi:hypothetical protein
MTHGLIYHWVSRRCGRRGRVTWGRALAMSEAFHSIVQIQTPFNMIVLVVLFGSIATVLSTIVTQIRKYATHRHELEFKRELVERGLEAEEIQQLLKTRLTASGK